MFFPYLALSRFDGADDDADLHIVPTVSTPNLAVIAGRG